MSRARIRGNPHTVVPGLDAVKSQHLDETDVPVWKRIEKYTISSDATIDLFFDSSLYQVIRLRLIHVDMDTNGSSIRLRVSIDGSTFVTSAVYSSNGTAAQDHIVLVSGMTTTNPTGLSGIIEVGGPGDTGGYQTFISNLSYRDSAGPAGISQQLGGSYDGANDILGIRLYSGLGNFASGTILVEGLL